MEFIGFKDWMTIRESLTPVAAPAPQQQGMPQQNQAMMAQKNKALSARAAQISKQMNIVPGKVTAMQRQALLANPEVTSAGKDMAGLISIITGDAG